MVTERFYCSFEMHQGCGIYSINISNNNTNTDLICDIFCVKWKKKNGASIKRVGNYMRVQPVAQEYKVCTYVNISLSSMVANQKL